MKPSRIIYYECDDPECGLRFPELTTGLERERCPVCRRNIHIVQVIDKSTLEVKSTAPYDTTFFMAGFLDNIRSSLNVGSIFRSADGIGLAKLILGGITPSPDNPGVKKTALGAEKNIAWETAKNGVEKLKQMKADEYSIWGLETVPEADSLYTLADEIPPQPLVLVAGNEICGIDPHILRLCDRIVSIPIVGAKQSYNVAIAFGIAASYIRYRQIFSQGSESRLPNTRSTP